MYSITEYVYNVYSIYNFPNPHNKSLFLWSDAYLLFSCGGGEKAVISDYKLWLLCD